MKNIIPVIKNIAKVVEYCSYAYIVYTSARAAYVKYKALVKGDPKAFAEMMNLTNVNTSNDVNIAGIKQVIAQYGAKGDC